MNKGEKNRRRQFFIDRSFQTWFIIKFCMLIVSTSVLAGVLIYLFNRQTTTVAFEDLKVIVPIMMQMLVIVTILVGVSTVFVALFTSHRIVGPLYRMKTELEKMKRGNLSSPIKVRSKDQLQGVASELESLRLNLKKSLGTIQKEWNSARALLEESGAGSKEGKGKLVKDAIGKIDSELARYKTE
jgi:signal transduction histidine kinase